MDGGVLLVYLTLIVTATGLLVTLSKNLQEVLGPFGRRLKARRERAIAKNLARMAAAAVATGTVADAVLINDLRSDLAWHAQQIDKLNERVSDTEDQSKHDGERAERAETEVRRVRADYGQLVEELRAEVDKLKLGRSGFSRG